jgi:site-specific DNA-methyltransferase (adenine-specific)/adenine-specific DNA-methyltransferase
MPTLDWIGKKAVVNHHRQVPYHLLRCDNALSCGDPDSGNLLIEGDNLLALKALLPYYAGQVKCIYIDPPYNTGNEKWKYNDNVNSPEIRKWLGKVVGAEGEDLSRSDKWLCMMYPRLCLLKEFLREDGVIFVSIDDDEGHYLKALMDEIFGRNNFVANIIWQKKFSPQNDAKWFSDSHDHIIVFAKDKKKWYPNLLERTAAMDERYENPDNDPRGVWTSSDMTVKTYSAEYDFPIITPSGKKILPTKGRCWFTSKNNVQKLIDDKRIWFGKNGSNVPRIKKFLTEVKGGITAMTIWLHSEVGHNQEAKQELNKILGEDAESIFDTPKPIRLIERIIQLSTDKNDIILDSFAGSGTTGHSVLSLNKKDGGNRWFVLVEMETDICNKITYNRLKSAINGYTYKQNNVEGLGGGFRYCRLDRPLFDETGKIGESVKFGDLAAHVFFTETGRPIPKRVNGASPFLGTSNGTGYYLLFNGILGDKTPDGGNVLTGKVLASLPKHNGPKVIFGEGCRLGDARLRREQITFKQLPYEIKVS